MCDFMTDDHAYATIIQRSGLGCTEERGLQNASWKDCKKPTSQLRPCLITLCVQCEQTIFMGFNQSHALPSDLPAAVSELTQGNGCGIAGTAQWRHSPLQTLAKS